MKSKSLVEIAAQNKVTPRTVNYKEKTKPDSGPAQILPARPYRDTKGKCVYIPHEYFDGVWLLLPGALAMNRLRRTPHLFSRQKYLENGPSALWKTIPVTLDRANG